MCQGVEFDQLINLLRKERIRVFVIGMDLLTDWCCQRDRSPRERAMDLIDTLTKETGGLKFLPKSAQELQNMANGLMPHLPSARNTLPSPALDY